MTFIEKCVKMKQSSNFALFLSYTVVGGMRVKDIDWIMNNDENAAMASLTEQEQKILQIMRTLDYGEVRIVVKAGIPVHVEEIKKSIKL